MTRPTTRATDTSTAQLKTPIQAGRKRELWKLHSQRCRVPVTRLKANPEGGDVWKSEMQGILHDFEKKCKVKEKGTEMMSQGKGNQNEKESLLKEDEEGMKSKSTDKTRGREDEKGNK